MRTFRLSLLLPALDSREGLAELRVPRTLEPRHREAPCLGECSPQTRASPRLPPRSSRTSARPSALSRPLSPRPIHTVGPPSLRKVGAGALDPPSVQHGPARAPGRGRPAREPENQLSFDEITAAWPAVSARQHRAASNRRFTRSTLENRGFLQALGVHGVRPQPREFLVGAVLMPCRLALGCGVLGCQVLI